jgi:hypothetical protein
LAIGVSALDEVDAQTASTSAVRTYGLFTIDPPTEIPLRPQAWRERRDFVFRGHGVG